LASDNNVGAPGYRPMKSANTRGKRNLAPDSACYCLPVIASASRSHMSARNLLYCLLLVFPLATACVETRTYVDPDNPLRQLLNKGTPDDVAKQLGPPTAKHSLSDGGEVWSYEFRSSSVSSGQEGTFGSSACRKLILNFDKEKVLREFHRENC
jgi:hypothetical protein